MYSKPTLANSSNESNASGGIEIQSGGIYISKWFQNIPSRQVIDGIFWQIAPEPITYIKATALELIPPLLFDRSS